MTKHEFAIIYLKAIEKKHKDYFEKAQLNLMNCVVIKGEKSVSVDIVNRDLPFEIRHDLEMMFWRD